MRSTGLRSLLRAVLLLALAVAAPARANDLDLGLRPAAPLGRLPVLEVRLNKAARSLQIELEAPGGRRVVLRRGALPPGLHELPIEQPEGRFRWQGRLSVAFQDGSAGEMPVSFETVVAGPPTLTSRATREDVLARRAVVVADRPVSKVEVEVHGDGGRVLGRTELPFGGAAAGTPLTLAWDQPVPGEPLRVKVTVHDTDGLTGGLEWLPWEVRIPHEEVVFDTGKAAVRDDQAPKLEAVLAQLREALTRYGAVAEVGLWIAGHTDTVGDAASNRQLSEARAASIGRWFRGRGIRVPIHYRGFGESAPAVATPDGTDEPRNRRAEYVVAGEDPYAGRDLAGGWRTLP